MRSITMPLFILYGTGDILLRVNSEALDSSDSLSNAVQYTPKNCLWDHGAPQAGC